MGFADNYTSKAPTNARKGSCIATTTRDGTLECIDSSGALLLTFPLNICDDDDPNGRRSLLIPDQEILDSTEEIYFQSDVDTGIYELNVSYFQYVLNICAMNHSQSVRVT